MPWSRNMIGWFMKTYLSKPINILQFLSRGKILKCLSQLQNILAFSAITHIPVGINENTHLMDCNNRKTIALGTNIYSIGLKNHWKLSESTIYIYTSCGNRIALKALWISFRLTNYKTAKATNLTVLIN